MTSLAAAISRDDRGPCALYLITDSRITWLSPSERWDAGRKTFPSPKSADVFGYCGDAYFMPIALSQVLNMVACGVIDLEGTSAQQRHSMILDQLKNSLGRISTKYASPVTVFHGAREGELMLSTFRLWRSEYRPALKSWITDVELPVEDRSYLAKIDGSGTTTVKKYESRISGTAAAGTSRAAIHAFCKSLQSGEDPYSGGPPQMVGLWRIGPARQFGFVWQDRFFVAGMEANKSAGRKNIDWFNDHFERCDPNTGKRRQGAPDHKTSLKSA